MSRVARICTVLALLAVAAMLTALYVLAGWYGWKGAPDFEFLYRAGLHIRHHAALAPAGDVGYLPWYLPAASRMFVGLAMLPGPFAGLAWATLNIVMLVTILRWFGRHFNEAPAGHWYASQLIPFLLTFPYWIYQFRLNQMTVLVLLLCVGSFLLWESGRRTIAGLPLGLAILMKTTPVILIGWLVLKRQWRTAGAAVVTCLLLGPVCDVAAFGASNTLKYYHQWYQAAVRDGSHRHFIIAQQEVDHRNQAVGVTMARVLHPVDCRMHFWNDPRMSTIRSHSFTVNLVDLPLADVADLYGKFALLIVVLLAFVMRRPAKLLNRSQLRLEWAVVLLAMMWFMPVLRLYHYAWAYPLLAMLCSRQLRRQAGISTRLAVAVVVLWVAPMVVLDSRLLRCFGPIVWAIFLIGALVCAAMVARQDRPSIGGGSASAEPVPSRSGDYV